VTARGRVRVVVGAPIVLVSLPGGLGDSLYHLPAQRLRAPRWRLRSVTTSESWETLCRLSGLVYALNGPVRERRLCSVCRAAAPAAELRIDGSYGELTRPPRRVVTRVPQLSDQQAELLHRIYREKSIGVPAIAELFWQRLGYANPVSCANAISRAFKLRGLPLRSRRTVRTTEARRLLGYGGQRPGEQRLTARTVDRLWRLYQAGHSVPEITTRFHGRFGYESEQRFRSVLEYAWKSAGRKLRGNREAELLSRARAEKRCAAMTSGADGCRPRPCPQRPLNAAITSRLLKGRHDTITVRYANRLLAPLGLSVEQLREPVELLRAA
jgi:hypothetical protein